MSAAQILHEISEEEKLWRAVETAKCDPLPLLILADYWDETGGPPGAGPLRVLAERRRFPLKMVRQELGEGFHGNTVYLRDYWGWTYDRPGPDRHWYLPKSYYLRLDCLAHTTYLCAGGGATTTYRVERWYVPAIMAAMRAMTGCPRTLKYTQFREEKPVGASHWVHLDVDEVRGETTFAFLLLLEGGEEVWIPKSQVASPGDYELGDRNCTISVTEWIAQKKGLD